MRSGEAIEHAQPLAREEGIPSGVSCGAAIAAALKLAKENEFTGKTSLSSCPMPVSVTSAGLFSRDFSTNPVYPGKSEFADGFIYTVIPQHAGALE